MKNIAISSLSSHTHLSLIQKSKVIKNAQSLVQSGVSQQEAITQSLNSVLVTKSSDKEMRISYDIIYEPNTPDFHGQWMSKETLIKAQADFKKAQEVGAVTENLYHLVDTDAFKIVDHWIQPELDVTVNGTGEIIKAGSWVAKVEYSPAAWELKKAGIVSGLSLQCGGVLNEETNELIDLDFSVQVEEDDN